MVENDHPPVETRVAREHLRAVIEDLLIPSKTVLSYSISDDREFPFPFEKPNALQMNGFFGESPDYNLVVKEIDELFNQPKRELEEDRLKLESKLEKASDEEILQIFEDYYYTSKGVRQEYEKALQSIKSLWQPYGQIKEELEKEEHSSKRKELIDNLIKIDDCHTQGLLTGLRNTKKLLGDGKRKEAKERVISNYSDWRRKNLAPLYNYCGDAKFYGAGFFIARLVCAEGEVETFQYGRKFKLTAEEALKNLNKKYQVVNI